MRLVEQFHKSLLDAFTPEELDQLLRFSFEKKLVDITSSSNNKSKQFLDVVDASISEGWMIELAQAAFIERSANEYIRGFYRDNVQPVLKGDLPRRKARPYYDDSDAPVEDRLRELEILLRGIDGYNGALSRVRILERLVYFLVIVRLTEIAMAAVRYFQ